MSRMDTLPPPLAYAAPTDAADRLRRAQKLFAWFTLAYAIVSLAMAALLLFTVRTTPALGGQWQAFLPSFATGLAGVPLLVGAVLMLSRQEAGATWIRVSSLLLVLAMLAATALRHAQFASMGGGTSAYQWGAFLAGLVAEAVRIVAGTPTLLFLLSFPLRRVAD
jgi:hypothetical protein